MSIKGHSETQWDTFGYTTGWNRSSPRSSTISGTNSWNNTNEDQDEKKYGRIWAMDKKEYRGSGGARKRGIIKENGKMEGNK